MKKTNEKKNKCHYLSHLITKYFNSTKKKRRKDILIIQYFTDVHNQQKERKNSVTN